MNKRTLAVIAALTLCVGNNVSAQQRCKKAGSETRPVAAAHISTIIGDNGPFQFRLAYWGERCEGDFEGLIRPSGSGGNEGLMDAKGKKVLVPAKYSNVLPLNETTAIVWSPGRGEGVLYTFGKGETGPAPHPGYGLLLNAEGELSTPYLEGPPMTLFLGGAEGVVQIRDSITLRRYENFAVLDLRAADGMEVSRVYDPAMRRPISPIVGKIEVWRMLPIAALGNRNLRNNAPSDLASRAMQVQHPHLPYDTLYLPLAPDGGAADLPEGALGVFPLRINNLSNPNEVDTFSDSALGWAVVYAVGEGVEIAPILGTLADALQQAPTARRFTGMHHQDNLYFGRHADGRWQVFLSGFTPLNYPIADLTYASLEEARFAFVLAVQQRGREQQLALEEHERQYAEHLRQEGDKEWARIQSGGSLCSAATRPGILPPEGLERYFRECEVDSNFLQNLGPGVSAEALGIAAQRTEEAARTYAEQRAQQDYERVFGGPVSEADPWARGLAAAEAAASASHNAFMQRQHSTYMTNLNAWNSGAQNWHTSRY